MPDAKYMIEEVYDHTEAEWVYLVKEKAPQYDGTYNWMFLGKFVTLDDAEMYIYQCAHHGEGYLYDEYGKRIER